MEKELEEEEKIVLINSSTLSNSGGISKMENGDKELEEEKIVLINSSSLLSPIRTDIVSVGDDIFWYFS